MNKLKRLWNKRKIKKKTDVYNQGEITQVIENKFDDIQLIPMDGKYQVPTFGAFDKTMRSIMTEEIAYHRDVWDCDKYAFLYKSLSALYYRINSIGIVLSFHSRHAFNIVITQGKNTELKAWTMEPQADKIWEPKDDQRDKYVIDEQIILI